MDDEEIVRRALGRAAAAAPPMSLDVADQLRRGARRRRTRRWGTGAVVIAGIAVLGTGAAAVASGGAPWGPPVAGPPPAAPSSAALAPTDTPAPTAEPSPTATPLTDAQLLGAFEVQTSDEQALADMRVYQEAVAACMQEAGFSYTPDVPDHFDHPTDPVQDEDWYATWGYGISIDLSAAYPGAVEVPDPNAPYVATLSESQRRSYDDALWGDDGTGNLGCNVESYDAVPRDAHPGTPTLVVELSQQVLVLTRDRMASDTRVADAVATLAQCAADAGAVGFDPHEPPGYVEGVGDVTVTPAYRPWSAYDQVQSAWDALIAAGPPDAATLAQFQQWERGMATAEFRCNAPLLALVDEVNARSLADVVEPRRAELEALLAARDDG